MGIFRSNQNPTAGRLNALANHDGINNMLIADTNNTTSFANLTGTSSFSFTKLHADTKLDLDIRMTLFVTLGSTVARLAVNVNSTDYDIAHLYFNDASKHLQLAGRRPITGLAAGTYTVRARWRRVSGTGVLTTDTDDWLSLSVTEVQ